MPQPLESRARYMPGLDGLRAVAVLAVIAYHLNLTWAPGGLLGVGVFFVLSGYLITNLLLAERERTGTIALGEFWRRRARRLFPALWVMLGVVILWAALGEPSRLPMLRGDVVAALLYYSNWWYAVSHVAYFASFGPPSPLGHLWSLAVEEQFYLVWPLLLAVGAYVLARRPKPVVPLVLRMRPALGLRPLLPVTLIVLAAAASAALMALMWSPGHDPDRVYYGTDTRAFELLLGAALAFVWPSRRLVRPLRGGQRATLDVLGFTGLAVIAVLIVVTDQYHWFIYRGGFLLLSVATVAVIAAASHPATLTRRVLGVAPLRWLGVRSYGVYLWHFPVIVLTTPLVDTTGPHVIRGLIQVGATVLIAAVSWRYVEQPIRLHGFGVLLMPLRSARFAIAGQTTALYDAAIASALVVGATGSGLVGLALPAR
ncbi:MAG: acyltransferase family protein, partial [Candidatus Dormibacteria bacterium]